MIGKSLMKRWSVKRKQEVGLRLLRGEGLDALSRETGLPAGVLSSWRDEFLEAGREGLKRRTGDPKGAALERELRRAKRLVGDLMRDKELLEMRIARFEGDAPFPKRRSNP
jgi:hypothetical protein